MARAPGIVAFRSTKGRSFAERKTTIITGARAMKRLSIAVFALLHLWPGHLARAQEQKQPAKQEIIGTVERLDPRFDALVPKDAQLEKIAEGFIWTEGAAWNKAGNFL